MSSHGCTQCFYGRQINSYFPFLGLINLVFKTPYALSEVFILEGMETVIGAGALVRQEYEKALGDVYYKWWFPKEQFPIP